MYIFDEMIIPADMFTPYNKTKKQMRYSETNIYKPKHRVHKWSRGGQQGRLNVWQLRVWV